MKTLVMALVLGGVSMGMIACEKKAEDTSEQPEATTPESTEEAKEEAKKPAAAAGDKAPESQAAAVVKVGEPAPDFTLMDQDGKEVKLSQFKGKPVVIEWTEKSCPYVVRHTKAKTMSKSHEASGGTDKVVWLAVDSSHFAKAEEIKAWRDKEGITYPVLVDADGKVGRMYNATNTPHLFVVDKEGVLRYSGAIDDDPRGDKKPEEVVNYVSKALGELAAGKPVENAETKAYGCSVKYGS